MSMESLGYLALVLILGFRAFVPYLDHRVLEHKLGMKHRMVCFSGISKTVPRFWWTISNIAQQFH